MIWKKDRLRSIQPYFVFDTESFYQEIYLRQGISHFYTYKVKNECPLRTVPDGCINLFFEYDNGTMRGCAFGTKLEYTCEEHFLKNEAFGVRFMPGVQPALINVTMRNLLGKKIPLEDIINDSFLLKKLEEEKDFYQRIRVFLEAYTKAYNKKPKPFGKAEIVQSVKQMVYDSDGKIKVSEIQERTGYTERYINKIFIEEMGFSPKIFCKIIQFQRALEFLNYGAPDNMTDAAVFLGYYDQPQFIRDFKKY
ncbi:MAG: helix-turn-helix domain-containing protein [Clostridiales bacterium]|nr:helix-turn-helix domain-containing protein [Clostridiales bacterium]